MNLMEWRVRYVVLYLEVDAQYPLVKSHSFSDTGERWAIMDLAGRGVKDVQPMHCAQQVCEITVGIR
jgi:hypothetical protein